MSKPEDIKKQIAEWIASEDGQRELADTLLSIKEAVSELQKGRIVDRSIIDKPTSI